MSIQRDWWPMCTVCNSLENLQPKWAVANLRKGALLEKHEQIPLGI